MFVSFRLLVVESICAEHAPRPIEDSDPRVRNRTKRLDPRRASISDDTIQIDNNAVVLFTIDRLARSLACWNHGNAGQLERPQTGGLYNKFAFEAV